MNRAIALVTGLSILGVAALYGCSGKTSNDTASSDGGGGASSSSGASSGSSSGSSGGTTIGPNAAECPASDPGNETSCSKEGLVCEYGNDFDPLCNQLRVCSSSHTWASPITFGGNGGRNCGSGVPTVPPNPAECPAAQASVEEGMACSAKGTTCNYDGAKCSCGAFCPSYPVGQPPCDPDAGITKNCCDTSKVEWHCFEGPSYCKTPRPRIGSPCTKDEECAIGEPAECGQETIACKDGVWSMTNSSCPISTAKAKEDIAYLDAAGRESLRAQTMNVRLATYKYKAGVSDGAPHLGFVIEDMPNGSPAVLRSREQVDLYGYVSMAVASLQEHDRKLGALETEVAELRAENARLRRVSGTK